MRTTGSGRGVPRFRFEVVSDERLVSRLRAGDGEAFELIYDRYERPIRSFCRHMLGHPEDADDAAQHVFLSAFRDIVQTTKRIDLRPWLFTIARNRCRSVLRARYRALAFCEGMAFEPSVDGLIAEVERREHLKDLLRDIARLPEDQRAALLLTQLDTLRHDQVAQVLEVPPDKVKALLFQARSSLLASQRARETPCGEIREQLVTLTGAGLRRRNLRRHLRDCAGCREFEVELKGRRRMLRALRGPKAPLRLPALGRH
jgi:RNA polymerase sigma factor (sigma-70 family)